MKPPASTAGTVAAAVGLLAVGGAVGALAINVSVRGRSDAQSTAFATAEGGIWGVLAAGFVGIVVTAASPSWRRVGETTALVGVGAPLVLASLGLAKTAMAMTGPAAPQLGSTVTVTSGNSGQTLALKVGDTVNVSLPSGMSAPTSSAAGVLGVGTSSATKDSAGNVTENYPFTAAAAGSTTLSSSSAGASFSLTVNVT